MDAVDQMLNAFNAADFDTMHSLMAEGYTYDEPMPPEGPHDAAAHVALLREFFEHAPGRRVEIIRRFAGTGGCAVETLWTGRIGGNEIRLSGIQVFELTEDGSRVRRWRCYYAT